MIDKAAPTTDAWAPSSPTAIESDESDEEHGPQGRLTGQLRRAVTLAPLRERQPASSLPSCPLWTTSESADRSRAMPASPWRSARQEANDADPAE